MNRNLEISDCTFGENESVLFTTVQNFQTRIYNLMSFILTCGLLADVLQHSFLS